MLCSSCAEASAMVAAMLAAAAPSTALVRVVRARRPKRMGFSIKRSMSAASTRASSAHAMSALRSAAMSRALRAKASSGQCHRYHP